MENNNLINKFKQNTKELLDKGPRVLLREKYGKGLTGKKAIALAIIILTCLQCLGYWNLYRNINFPSKTKVEYSNHDSENVQKRVLKKWGY